MQMDFNMPRGDAITRACSLQSSIKSSSALESKNRSTIIGAGSFTAIHRVNTANHTTPDRPHAELWLVSAWMWKSIQQHIRI
jgi:hypothetical protein